MTNKFKKLAAIGLVSISMVMAATVIAANGANSIFNITSADDAGITLDGSNGAVSATTLKTTISDSTTALGNNVQVVYKNAAVVSGKVGTVKAKGYYGNYDPIWAMSRITVSSDAATGDAVIKYGKTSACIDGSVDLATGVADGINANYFKIVATNDVTVNSVSISFACDNSANGYEASYGDTDKSSEYEFVSNSYGGYDFRVKSASSAHYADKIVVPDYYGTGSDYMPVNRMMETGYYGFFEKAYNVEKVYLPETITTFGKYFFDGTHNYIKEFTYPRDLTTTTTSGRIVPSSTSLTTVYYNSKNLTYSGSSGFNSSYQTALKDLYVSYDVESLPNSMVTSFPSDMTLHYEGTEAEWAALTASASNWNKASTIICSDTVVATATFVYANSTLNGDDSGTYTAQAIVGKTLADPGRPVWTGEGSKVFDGWYTEADGGDKVTFPYTMSGDITLYAHFTDMPVGYSVSDPVIASIGTYSVETSSDLGYAKYYSYTATADQVVYFEASDIVSSSSKSCELRVFSADGTQIDIGSMSYSAAECAKTVSNLKNKSSSLSTVKINFKAGETYIVGLSTYNFTTGYYGTATLKIFDGADVYGDASVAKPYELGTDETMTDLKENIPVWHSFTPTTSGTYTIYFNNAGDKNCANSLGYFKDGTYTELAKSNYTATTAYAELTAGTTYYIVNTGNGTAGTYGFKVAQGTPDGYSANNPITITVDGAAVTNSNQGFNYNYFKFNAPTDGWYKLTCSKTVYSQSSTSYSSTSSYQYVQLSKNADMSDLISGDRELANSSASSEIYYNLTAGDHYLKATVYSSSTTFAISSVSDPEGLTVDTAKAITLTSGTAIDTSDAGTNGKLYKFTVTSDQFHVFTADSSATVKIGTVSSSSLVKNFSASYTMSSGEMHKKLTVGDTYYMFVKGATSVGFETVATIEDGASADTAYTYTLGTQEKTTSNSGRVGSTCTYFKFTPDESCDYVVTRGSTSSYYFKLKDGDSSVSGTSVSGNSYQYVYTLTAGKTYTIEAYSYGFLIEKAQPGFAKTAAIETTVTAEQTSVDLACTFGTSGTWYKFTADYTGWYEFTTSSTATLTVYIGTSTTAACSATSSVKGDASVTSGDTVYLCVSGTADTTVTFNIAHPTSVENGLSADTALTYACDEGQNYMTLDFIKGTNTDSNGYFWLKATVEANTEYVFYSLSENDWDFSAVYASDKSTSISTSVSSNDTSLSKTDTIGDSSITISDKTGSTNSNDFYVRFSTGENTTIYLKARLYSSSSTGLLTLTTSAAFVA